MQQNQPANFKNRIGFVLASVGSAVGMGNIWMFPYRVGQYGGAAFVLIYLFFLVVLGLPIMAMEFAVGRASRKSCAVSFRVLEPAGTKWHWYAWLGMAGNYLLMMFYTTVAGSFSTLYDEELVRLVVFRRRSYAPRLKDAFKLFRLDGLGEIGADGISFLGKREKVIHGKPPKLFARTIGV